MALDLTNSLVQQAIRQLEEDKEIKPVQKALILMVADESKPATWQQISSEKWTEGNKETRIKPERWEELNTIFDALGLVSITSTRLDDSTFVQPKDGTHQWIELADMSLSKHPEQANRLAAAIKSGDHREIGLALGFPKSAVDAFMTKELLPISEWPASTKTISAESMKFLNHMVSKDNWKEEIRYLSGFSKRVKELSEKIYYECLERQL